MTTTAQTVIEARGLTRRFGSLISVEENLEFAAEIFGLPRQIRSARVEESLTDYGLHERRQQRPATLSGGWKQRLALAVATIHRPEILFLDEPTAGVDPDNRRRFWEKIFGLAGDGATVLVSTHYMDEAVRCHRLCIMLRGRPAAVGAPAELTRELSGRVVELIAEPADDAIAELRTLESVASVTQLGRSVHVLLAPGAALDAAAQAPALAAHLTRCGLSCSLAEPADPNLEDVFVALIEGETLGASENEP